MIKCLNCHSKRIVIRFFRKYLKTKYHSPFCFVLWYAYDLVILKYINYVKVKNRNSLSISGRHV